MVRTSDDARWPIADQKNDEHLREKSTLDLSSKRASLLRTTLKTRPCATPESPRSALGEQPASAGLGRHQGPYPDPACPRRDDRPPRFGRPRVSAAPQP